jgi:CMP-N-acetylneuraminic acid synthetase
MWNNLQTLIIVPARGGSKGVLKKNLRTVNGKSLIQIVGEFSMNLDFVDK